MGVFIHLWSTYAIVDYYIITMEYFLFGSFTVSDTGPINIYSIVIVNSQKSSLHSLEILHAIYRNLVHELQLQKMNDYNFKGMLGLNFICEECSN